MGYIEIDESRLGEGSCYFCPSKVLSDVVILGDDGVHGLRAVNVCSAAGCQIGAGVLATDLVIYTGLVPVETFSDLAEITTSVSTIVGKNIDVITDVIELCFNQGDDPDLPGKIINRLINIL